MAVAMAMVGCKPKKGTLSIYLCGRGGLVGRGGEPICEWLWNTVSLLQVIAKKKEGEDGKKGRRQDDNILNRKKKCESFPVR